MHLWQEDPHLLVVVCTAYSDYSWEEMSDRLGLNDRLLILKKPFDIIEVRQLAHALTEKWNLARRARFKLHEVERMVNERTQELEEARDELRTINEQLATARDAAEGANRSKSALLASVSHEIRTPLTAILGVTDLIGDPNQSSAEREDYLETIQRNGGSLLAIINDILDLSKIETGRLATERVACSPAEIVTDVISLMRVEADRKGLALEAEFSGRIPARIKSDPTRLRQILTNLVGNAIKFTERGHVLIRTAMDPESGAEEPWPRFDVCDTGIGLSSEQIAGLFVPFVQAEASTARRFGGTGLGLTISRRLARALGGDITVDSEPDRGSTFRVTIAAGPLDGVDLIEPTEARAAWKAPHWGLETNPPT